MQVIARTRSRKKDVSLKAACTFVWIKQMGLMPTLIGYYGASAERSLSKQTWHCEQ